MTRFDASTTLRLLVVEDDPTDLEWLEVMLKNANVCPYDIDAVPTVREAEDAVTGAAYDCVLLDLSLPDTSGMETVDRILAAAPRTPVVVFTHSDDLDLGLRAIDAGAQEYLVKGQASGSQILRAAMFSAARASSRFIDGEAGEPSGTGGMALGAVDAPWAVLDAQARIATAGTAMEGLIGTGALAGSSFLDLLDDAGRETFKAGFAHVRIGELAGFVRPFDLTTSRGVTNVVATVVASGHGHDDEPAGALVILTPGRTAS